MVRLIDILKESLLSLLSEIEFDIANKYTWKKDASGLRYTFNTSESGKDGIDYEVVFEPHKENEDETSSTFERMYRPIGKGYAMTGAGNALKVNATVMDATLDFMKTNRDWYDIIISPIEAKRLKLVKNFIDKNVPKDKFFVEEEEGIIRITRRLYAVKKEKPKAKKKRYAA